jgi:hypothetical protein
MQMRTHLLSTYLLASVLCAPARRSAAASGSEPAPAASPDAWNGEDEGQGQGPTIARATQEDGGSQEARELAQASNTALDPIDAELQADEAARRAELPNTQTTHELFNGLDPVSGTPNPGVTEQQSGAHTQPGRRGSDMAGNAPKPDPFAALDPKHVSEIRTVLQQADRQDVASFKANKGDTKEATEQRRTAHERSAGWRSLADLGVHKATLDALVQSGHVETGSAPGMSYHGDTGRMYRIKRERA